MQGHIPTDFLLDCEKAATNSAEINFNAVDIKGCFFHLCSNICKKIQNSGMKQLYENDQEFSTLMRMVACLAFVPTLDVPQASYDLDADIHLNYNNHNGVDAVLDYVEDTYIGRRRRWRPRDIPMFPVQIWNMYDRTVAQLPRTNNNIEGWHRRFQTTCGCAHPNIWKFINILQNQGSLIHAEIQQALGGHAALPQKRVYADSAARVRNIMIDYPNRRRNVLHYLRSTSYNIGF